jgi:hypothetical protein
MELCKKDLDYVARQEQARAPGGRHGLGRAPAAADGAPGSEAYRLQCQGPRPPRLAPRHPPEQEAQKDVKKTPNMKLPLHFFTTFEKARPRGGAWPPPAPSLARLPPPPLLFPWLPSSQTAARCLLA